LPHLPPRPLPPGQNDPPRFILPTVAATPDLTVNLPSDGTGRRLIDEVLAVPGRVEHDQVEAGPVYRRSNGHLGWTGQYPPHIERYHAAGYNLVEVLGG